MQGHLGGRGGGRRGAGRRGRGHIVGLEQEECTAAGQRKGPEQPAVEPDVGGAERRGDAGRQQDDPKDHGGLAAAGGVDDRLVTALLGNQEQGGDVGGDADAAEHGGDDEGDADEGDVDPQMAGQAGGDAGDHAALAWTFQARGCGLGFSGGGHGTKDAVPRPPALSGMSPRGN